MFFGVLCTYAIAYGVFTLFDSFVSAFTPQPLSLVTDYVAEKLDEFRLEDLKYQYGEGILDSRKTMVLTELLPCLAEYESEVLSTYLHTTYFLTHEELVELTSLLDPIDGFEKWATRVPPVLRDAQRGLMLEPVLRFLDKIPPLRRSNQDGDA